MIGLLLVTSFGKTGENRMSEYRMSLDLRVFCFLFLRIHLNSPEYVTCAGSQPVFPQFNKELSHELLHCPEFGRREISL